jgi:hypothetical protein
MGCFTGAGALDGIFVAIGGDG